MKLKLLLLFLFVVSCGVVLQAQSKKPYNQLLITEIRLADPGSNYVEVTNMGTEKIDLAEFEIARFDPWPADNWTPNANNFFRLWDPKMYPKNSPLLNKRYLDPGKSFLIAMAEDFQPEQWLKDPLHNAQRTTKLEFYKIADLLLHKKESNSIAGLDSITPNWQLLEAYWGYNGMFLRHHFINETTGKKDSMVIDVFNGQFDDADGTNSSKCDCGFDVAGFTEATRLATLVRKFSVKQGITDFTSHDANIAAAKLQFNHGKGIDVNDSEWFPIPNQGAHEAFKAVYWTAGNHVDAKLDATTLVPKNPKVQVDLANMKITVPWGVRADDSLMFQFNKKPGLAWQYKLSGASQADSATISVTKGDTLVLYISGAQPAIKRFVLDVLPPTSDDNIVIPKNGFDWTRMRYSPDGNWAYNAQWNRLGLEVTDKVKGMDTIRGLNFATRIDTMLRYLEKAPKATWQVIPKSGVVRPDLQTGDILRVTSESGKAKDYYIKLFRFYAQSNAYLGSITWPDMPTWFKGDVAKAYGWAGDTIPGFTSSNSNYIVKIPAEYDGIPGLAYTKQQLDSKVTVKRATSLNGTPAERTVTFTAVAEDDSTKKVYTVRFEKEKDPANIQPWKGEPFISQFSFKEDWANDYMEIVNPGTEPLDLSNYMFVFSWGQEGASFSWDNGADEWGNRYHKYVPGKKWQDEANWKVQPRILIPDLATNAIVYPGDVFVMAVVSQNRYGKNMDTYFKEIDVNFPKSPWNETIKDGYAPLFNWWNANTFIYKITNDSVKNGLKPATNIKDFQFIEAIGNNMDGSSFKIGGTTVGAIMGYYRKPNIYKPNPVLKGSYGTTKENSEWYWTTQADFVKLKYGWPQQILAVLDGIGSHVMDEVTIYRSTVSSKVYKVSPGYGKKETIKGLTTGTTVTGFYNNIIKANELQSLKVKSVATGKELAATDAIAKGDSLIVLSADSTNTSKYILDVTTAGLSSNALLTSTKYTINVTGTTGTITGIPQRTALKTVLANVIVPVGATMTMLDENDAYMTLTKLNYDTVYVNALATDKVFFEVIAENGTTKVLYQLKPNVNASDAYVTSDVYSVDQFASLIQFIPGGTSVPSLLKNVYPCTGATLKIFDKAGYERTTGDIYKDDKLIVTSQDGKTVKAYYFSMLVYNKPIDYLAYVISDDYVIDQVAHTIKGPKTLTTLGEFYAKLYPSFGATLKVLDKNGNESKLADLSKGDQLLVTAADLKTTFIYQIDVDITGFQPIESGIKMYPNPTNERVIINGLTKGNRVRVFNSIGVTLRDVIVDNSTEYVSLAYQPAGIYVFVISDGEQNINIQKIVKR
jgi:hypothetical protein